jgi:hypothetical protein
MRLAGVGFTAQFLTHNRHAVGERGIEPADGVHISTLARKNGCELCGHSEDCIRVAHDIVIQLDRMADERPALSVLDEDAYPHERSCSGPCRLRPGTS